MALTQEQKDLKRLAKRIVKAVKEPLEAAMKKEAELRGLELEEQLRKLDSMGIFASTTSKIPDADGEDETQTKQARRRTGSDTSVVAGAEDQDNADMPDAEPDDAIPDPTPGKDSMIPFANDSYTHSGADSHASSHQHATMSRSDKPTEPISPPISRSSSRPSGFTASANGDSRNHSGESHDVFAQGGVPWYLEPFDPVGTTIHEERYTGRAVLRAMSEELSDMDEDTLTELAVTGAEALSSSRQTASTSTLSSTPGFIAKKASSKKKRSKRSQWSR